MASTYTHPVGGAAFMGDAALQHHRIMVVPKPHMHLHIIMVVFFLALAGIAAAFFLSSSAPVDPIQAVDIIRVQDALHVGGGHQVGFFDWGSSAVTLGTTLPTQTQVYFSKQAPSAPVVTITPYQTDTYYTGLSFSVSQVTNTGFVLLVDAIGTGTTSTGDAVTLDRVPPLTQPLSVNWIAIA